MDDLLLGGLRFVPNSYLPSRASNFRLNPDVPLSDAFRRDMQAWLDGFFGTHAVAFMFDPAAVGFAWMGDKIVATHPENIHMLRHC